MRSLLIAISGMTVLYSFSDGEGKQWFVEQCAATGQGVWVEGKLWALVFSPLLHQSLFNLVFFWICSVAAHCSTNHCFPSPSEKL